MLEFFLQTFLHSFPPRPARKVFPYSSFLQFFKCRSPHPGPIPPQTSSSLNTPWEMLLKSTFRRCGAKNQGSRFPPEPKGFPYSRFFVFQVPYFFAAGRKVFSYSRFCSSSPAVSLYLSEKNGGDLVQPASSFSGLRDFVQYIHTQIHTHIYTYTHIHTYTHTSTHIHAHTPPVHKTTPHITRIWIVVLYKWLIGRSVVLFCN